MAFDAVASDVDLDGDPDLLISWHHVGPLELFESRDGGFVRLDLDGGVASGLADAPGVDDLFAPPGQVERHLLGPSASPGLYVWHDEDRLGSWRLLWTGPRAGSPELDLIVETSLGFSEVEGADPPVLTRAGARALRVTARAEDAPLRLRVKAEGLTDRLTLRLGDDDQGTRFRVGRFHSPLEGPSVELWKPDPHGLAWVDVEGSPHPDLYVTRGGLAGLLRPPLPGKRDRLFRHRGGGAPLYALAPPGAVPRDHRRGRQVEWVDPTGDGALALSVTGRGSRNGLLVRDAASGALRDVAPLRGLAFPDAEVASWGDLDEDGLPDLFFLAGDAIDVARNRGPGRRFERIAGAALGLRLPPQPKGEPALFEQASLRQADFDADGRLDLWLLGRGPGRQARLFLRRGEGFEPAGAGVGLDALDGSHTVVVFDADADSYPDALGFGPERAVLLWNRGGERFEARLLDAALVPETVHAAVAGDFDGDGALDVAAVGNRRHLLRNRTRRDHGHLEVVLRGGRGEPVGALVRARYSDGRASLQRYGSMRSSGFSQSLQPLFFGIPSGARLEQLAVRWVGSAEEEVFAAGPPGGRVVLEKGAGR